MKKEINKIENKKFKKVTKVVDILTYKLAFERGEDLLAGSSSYTISPIVLQYHKSIREKKIYIQEITNSEQECAFLDLCALVLMFFFEGVKISSSIDCDDIAKEIYVKMEEYFIESKKI